ncbi:MAG: hypothetical protein ACI9VS_000908 [Candidatus Binatia bacterium]
MHFSDAANPFGFTVFPEDVKGNGTREWTDGLWLFDDGQLDAYAPTTASQ